MHLYHFLKLSDGISIGFRSTADGKGINVAVDINGPKGPNICGYDLFYFKVLNNGKVFPHNEGYVSSPETPIRRYCACQKTANGESCSAYILENDNMDYLDE